MRAMTGVATLSLLLTVLSVLPCSGQNAAVSDLIENTAPSSSMMFWAQSGAGIRSQKVSLSTIGQYSTPYLSLTSLGGLAIVGSSLQFDYSSTLGGVTLAAGQCVFSNSGNGGIVCEGSTSNTNRTFITLVNPTADRTIILPDTTGTVVTTGDSATVTPTMLDRAYVTTTGHFTVTQTTAPTATCTGTGTSPPAPTVVGSDTAYTITMNTGTLPGSSGTCTTTYNGAFVTNIPIIVCGLTSGASAWGAMATVTITTPSLTAPVLTWDNTAGGVLASLTASSSYKISCIAIDRLP